jgi:hypothetical protein
MEPWGRLAGRDVVSSRYRTKSEVRMSYEIFAHDWTLSSMLVDIVFILLWRLVRLLICLFICLLILRWLLGIFKLERRVETLERELKALREPPPPRPPSPTPRRMTIHTAADSVLEDLPKELSLLRIMNGRPGLRALEILVNEARFDVVDLIDGEERDVDVAAAMRSDEPNRLLLKGSGGEGAKAEIVIEAREADEPD